MGEDDLSLEMAVNSEALNCVSGAEMKRKGNLQTPAGNAESCPDPLPRPW